MTKSALSKEVYKDVKRYNRKQMENFFIDIYLSGFKEGATSVNSTAQGVDRKAVEKEVRELLRKEFGIGDKRYKRADIETKIMKIIDKNTYKIKVEDADVVIDDEENKNKYDIVIPFSGI